MTETAIVSRRSMVVIAITGLVFAIAAYVGSRYMQRAYMSTVQMLSAVEDTDRNTLARVSNQLGAVAGLLGVGATGGRRDVNEGLATLRSRLLVADFLRAEELLDDILTVLGPERVAELGAEDRLQAAVTYFQDAVLGVSYDTRTSLMVVSITWVDRHRAAELANKYIAFANEAMRQRGIASARLRIAFLEKAGKDAATVDLRQAIYRLMEAQINEEMMAATKPDYAFLVVDPAVPAGVDQYVRPQSFLLAIVAAMLGGALAAAVLYFRGHIRGPRPPH
jgi:uncharacterized protein involved in exopolysaccharide biosynthesis